MVSRDPHLTGDSIGSVYLGLGVCTVWQAHIHLEAKRTPSTEKESFHPKSSNHQPTPPLCPQHYREPLIPISSLSTAPSALQFNTGALCGGLDWVSKHCQKRKTLDKKKMGSSAALHQICRKPRMPMNTQWTESPSRGAKPETTWPGGPEEHKLPPMLKPRRVICTQGRVESGQPKTAVAPRRSIHVAPPHGGDDLTSSVKSSIRLSNSHSTGGRFGQDRKEMGKPSLTWPSSRLGLQMMPQPNTQPAGSRTQCLALPWLVLRSWCYQIKPLSCGLS